LREGRIVEKGTHDELLERGGYYEDLYQKQLLEEELERA
jgi:ATP-binding cassette subfamily B protein